MCISSIVEAFTAQRMKFSMKDFFSKCDQILNKELHFFGKYFPSESEYFSAPFTPFLPI